MKNFKNFSQITDLNLKPKAVTSPTKQFIEMLFKDDANIELWLYLDQILLDLADQELTWLQLIDHYQHNHPDIIKHVLP